MRTLFVFNPDNDLALASGVKHFTPPPHARQIAHDLCTLPYILANKGDYVLVEDEQQAEWLTQLDLLFEKGVVPVLRQNLPNDIERIIPWGWSRAIVARLLSMGLRQELMPKPEQLDAIRKCSSRVNTVTIIAELQQRNLADPCRISKPIVCNSVEELATNINSIGKCIIKAPWSSSGKGIYIPISAQERPMLQWSAGIIKRQGNIIIEPLYNRVLDFAMEFYVNPDSAVTFAGYSVFYNDSHNSYDRSIVASTSTLENAILAELPHLNNQLYLLNLRDFYCEYLSRFVPHGYCGYVGVDMMVCEDGNGLRFINPCVELNLRSTMGVVACKLSDSFVAENTTARFRVLFRGHNEIIGNTSCPIINNGKLSRGNLLLNPIYPDTVFCALITIDNE